MNLYLIVFLLLAVDALAEIRQPKLERWLYPVCWGFVTMLLVFRFGQGTDYVTYHAIYETIPPAIDWPSGHICGYYPEIGWRLLSAGFKLLQIPFWGFCMVLGAADMLLIHRFLKNYVPWKVAGLFFSYPVLIFVYLVSGLRQGLAICIFLGLALPFYLERKWIPYVASVLLAASFHKVGYAWLILVPAAYFPVKLVFLGVGLSAAGGLLLQIPWMEQMLTGLIPVYHVRQFLLEGNLSLFAVGERLASFAVIAFLYVRREKQEEDHEKEQVLKAYLCGVCFYLLLCGNAYYASRYAVIFKVLECVLIVWLLEGRDRLAKLAAVYFFGLTLLMGVKNLQAAAEEGGYTRQEVNAFNYPYVSIFWKERINDYYDYTERLNEKYEILVEDQMLWMIEQ